jgi:two-component system, chemotaxis family, protein-glutamate methylesterase/glutaminase
MNPIRVMIVEDSRVVREYLEYVIGRDSRLEVAAAAASAEEALRLLHEVSPDVISMDIRLPGMNGLEATQRIMKEKPTPIVVVAASVDSEDLHISINALRIGALAIVEKPVGVEHRDCREMADRLCNQLVLMSQVKVIRQRFRPAVALEPAKPRMARAAAQRSGSTGPFCMAGIVSSTGGPAALQKLLGEIDPHFPIPIALVQHMADGFLGGFVSWLDCICPLHVTIAADGEKPLPGSVYVAPAQRHLYLKQGAFHLDAGPPVSSQRPSGTALFRSMASLGTRALGILLTGMGEDGAAGLKDLHDAGGYTIAEDESTVVVYGMPRAAVMLGAVDESLPLPRIGPRLEELVERRAANAPTKS